MVVCNSLAEWFMEEKELRGGPSIKLPITSLTQRVAVKYT